MGARAIGTRAPMLVPGAPNDRWSLDFVSDQFTDGRRFRILTVVDDCTRECVGAGGRHLALQHPGGAGAGPADDRARQAVMTATRNDAWCSLCLTARNA